MDVVALEYCLQQLAPCLKDLENADTSLIWCNRVHCIRPIIQVMKSEISSPSEQQIGNEPRIDVQLSKERSAHILQNCRCEIIQ